MFVQAVDGMWYRNPTLLGKDYIIVCAEGETPMLYAKYANARSNLKSTRTRITSQLKKLVKIAADGQETMAMFGTKVHLAGEWDVEFKMPIPLPINNQRVHRPALHSTFIGWKLAFSRQEILDHVSRAAYSLMIAEFVLARRVINENVTSDDDNFIIDSLLQHALWTAGETLTLERKPIRKKKVS